METVNDTRPAKSPHATKRTAAQQAADLAFIEPHVLRGKTQLEIANLLSAERPYRISRQTVGLDVDRLKKLWIASGVESFGLAQARALRKLEEVEREAWILHERTKLRGNADGLKKVLEVHDRVSRLLGLDAATRLEMSGPGGAPIATTSTENINRMTQEEKDELLVRHYERIQRKRAAQATLSEAAAKG